MVSSHPSLFNRAASAMARKTVGGKRNFEQEATEKTEKTKEEANEK
jgi:hypothetical protein